MCLPTDSREHSAAVEQRSPKRPPRRFGIRLNFRLSVGVFVEEQFDQRIVKCRTNAAVGVGQNAEIKRRVFFGNCENMECRQEKRQLETRDEVRLRGPRPKQTETRTLWDNSLRSQDRSKYKSFRSLPVITAHSVTSGNLMTSLCKHNRYSMQNRVQISVDLR